jgi:hypothetical protein
MSVGCEAEQGTGSRATGQAGRALAAVPRTALAGRGWLATRAVGWPPRRATRLATAASRSSSGLAVDRQEPRRAGYTGRTPRVSNAGHRDGGRGWGSGAGEEGGVKPPPPPGGHEWGSSMSVHCVGTKGSGQAVGEGRLDKQAPQAVAEARARPCARVCGRRRRRWMGHTRGRE